MLIRHPPRTLLLSIGISGFLLQLLLTEGLQREKAGRATNLIVGFSLRPSLFLEKTSLTQLISTLKWSSL